MIPHPASIGSSRASAHKNNVHSPSKRFVDLSLCFLALPFLLLITGVLALHLALTSPGPVFFRQDRVGHRGRKFSLYKFRTMKVRSETDSHRNHFATLVRSNEAMQKLDARGDSRLITGGWLLRSSGLDELPQIINVMRGEMSIVGPRPCLPYEYEHYTPLQRQRFDCLPGLTGLWQVSGKNRTTFEEMVALDVDYTRRCSLTLDLKIVALTIPALCVQMNDICVARLRSEKGTGRTRNVQPIPNPPCASPNVAQL
jgi:lipopolysaccharide/colanic/teichoic acid biosynthesis glycosyltransferase